MTIAIRRLDYGKKSWVATGPALHFVEVYRPHVVRLEGGGKGVKGRTPFEALYRFQKLTQKDRYND